MNTGKIAVRYAKALLLLGKEQHLTEVFRDNLLLIDTVIKNSKDLLFVLESPVATNRQKWDVLQKIFSGEVHPHILSFLHMIIKNHREIFLKDIIRNYNDLYRHDKGIVPAAIISPVALDEILLDRIKAIIKNTFKSEVELTEEIKPELIGGFILRVGDQQIDQSISGQLKKLKNKLINSDFTKKH